MFQSCGARRRRNTIGESKAEKTFTTANVIRILPTSSATSLLGKLRAHSDEQTFFAKFLQAFVSVCAIFQNEYHSLTFKLSVDIEKPL